jgi:hypothetical protein
VESSVQTASRSPADRRRVGQRAAAQRSKITNGKQLLPGLDMRSAMARRFKDITSAIYVDQGGEDRCSESRKQLIRRFAAAAVIAEQMESRLANGGTINVTEHAQLSSTLVRIAQRIGLGRRLKDITPALPDYLDAAETEAEARKAADRDRIRRLRRDEHDHQIETRAATAEANPE